MSKILATTFLDQLNDLAGLLIVISAVLVLVLIAVLIAVQQKVVKAIVVKKFKFSCIKELEQYNTKYSVIIANGSLSDINIKEMGIVLSGEYYNCMPEYVKANNVPENHNVTVLQRQFVKLVVDSEEITNYFYALLRHQGKKAKSLKVYVIDTAGNISVGKAKNIFKDVKARFAVYAKAEREAIKNGTLPPPVKKPKIVVPTFVTEPAPVVEETPVEAPVETPVEAPVAEAPVGMPVEEAPVETVEEAQDENKDNE